MIYLGSQPFKVSLSVLQIDGIGGVNRICMGNKELYAGGTDGNIYCCSINL